MRTRGNGGGAEGGGRVAGGRLVAAPTFVDGHGGHPERDVEGAVPYEGVRTRGFRNTILRRGCGRQIASPTLGCEPGASKIQFCGRVAGGRLGIKV